MLKERMIEDLCKVKGIRK